MKDRAIQRTLPNSCSKR